MKNYLITSLLILFGAAISAQSGNTGFRMISKANFSALASQMDDEVELILPRGADFYSKQEAVKLLRSAIQRIKPVSWKERHVGGTRGGNSTYSVGHLKAASGQSFRLYIVKEKIAGELKIVSIELERQ